MGITVVVQRVPTGRFESGRGRKFERDSVQSEAKIESLICPENLALDRMVHEFGIFIVCELLPYHTTCANSDAR